MNCCIIQVLRLYLGLHLGLYLPMPGIYLYAEQYPVLQFLVGRQNSYLDLNFAIRFFDVNLDPRMLFDPHMMHEPLSESYQHAIVARILELKQHQPLKVVQVTLIGRVECEYPDDWLTELIQELVAHRIFVRVPREYESISRYCLLSKPGCLTSEDVDAMTI